MSEYQYHEFCNLSKPLDKETRQVMHSLSSRAKVSTHSASYVYNYSDFRGDTKQLLMDFFDVYFYICNFGVIELKFKYKNSDIDADRLKRYCLNDVVYIDLTNNYTVLNICISIEDFDSPWLEADDFLPDLLPIYDEIKDQNYSVLDLISNLNNDLQNGESLDIQKYLKSKNRTDAQKSLIEYVGLFSS